MIKIGPHNLLLDVLPLFKQGNPREMDVSQNIVALFRGEFAGTTVESLKHQSHHLGRGVLRDKSAMSDGIELELLSRIYAPELLVVTKDALKPHLPVIIDNGNLNFLLHKLLLVMVSKFIALWYLTKLNTDNFLFLVQVYLLLVDIARDLVTRIQAVDLNRVCIELPDQVARVIENHIKRVEESDDSYLKYGHPIIYSDYLIVLARLLLEATLKENPLATSVIASDLVEALVGNVVLGKTVEKLLSPQFCNQIITLTAGAITAALSRPAPLVMDRVRTWVRHIKTMIGDYAQCNQDSNTNILFHNGWLLAATVFNIPIRRPMVAYTMEMARVAMTMVPGFSRWVNVKVDMAVSAKLAMSPEQLADLIDGLTEKLFVDGPPGEEYTSEQAVEAIIAAVNKCGGSFWYFSGEDDTGFRRRVQSQVAMFQHHNTTRIAIAHILDLVIKQFYNI